MKKILCVFCMMICLVACGGEIAYLTRIKVCPVSGGAYTISLTNLVVDIDTNDWTATIIQFFVGTNGISTTGPLTLYDPETNRWSVTIGTNGVLSSEKM